MRLLCDRGLPARPALNALRRLFGQATLRAIANVSLVGLYCSGISANPLRCTRLGDRMSQLYDTESVSGARWQHHELAQCRAANRSRQGRQ